MYHIRKLSISWKGKLTLRKVRKSCSFFPFTSPFSNSWKFGTNPLPGLTCLESRERMLISGRASKHFVQPMLHELRLGSCPGFIPKQKDTIYCEDFAIDIRWHKFNVCVRPLRETAWLNEVLLIDKGFTIIANSSLHPAMQIYITIYTV